MLDLRARALVGWLLSAAVALAAYPAQAQCKNPNCPFAECPDADCDCVCDADDNCPDWYNPPPGPDGMQVDSDKDGIGDDCDCNPDEHAPYCIGDVRIVVHGKGLQSTQTKDDCGAVGMACKNNDSCPSPQCGPGKECGTICAPCESAQDCVSPKVCSVEGKCVRLDDALSEGGGCSTRGAASGEVGVGALLVAAALVRISRRRRRQNR